MRGKITPFGNHWFTAWWYLAGRDHFLRLQERQTQMGQDHYWPFRSYIFPITTLCQVQKCFMMSHPLVKIQTRKCFSEIPGALLPHPEWRVKRIPYGDLIRPAVCCLLPVCPLESPKFRICTVQIQYLASRSEKFGRIKSEATPFCFALVMVRPSNAFQYIALSR